MGGFDPDLAGIGWFDQPSSELCGVRLAVGMSAVYSKAHCVFRVARLRAYNLFPPDVGGTHLNISAWPYTMDDLEKAKHDCELPHRENITLNIDYKQQGVGGDVPAMAVLHSEFKLKKNVLYNYCFRLRPYSKDMGEITSFAFKIPPKF